ncbi:hypothetical protein E3E14_28500 [Streptomyces sp. ICN441]|uniref:Uncharacterized protein n=1 Tax=Streptomyces tirandamycinicus TaxID=2174846 RepID=A0A2S1SP32_9ACTN|nr:MULTISPECIES: hypothetical protein [Streptomyces]AWI28153.1 hypothetical protein DDW44_04595 [Streptomyces tirandamycinicus]TFE38481.1 hypothetical protein E3E14_28500 [Streptomyces sp. ICN441]
MAVVAGVAALAMILVLATCGGGGGRNEDRGDRPKRPEKAASGPSTRLTVPAAYDTARGWEVSDASPDYALAARSGLLAYLERVADDRFRLRTLRTGIGRPGWSGEPFTALAGPEHFPRLLSVTKDGRQFFVVWSYGKTGRGSATPSGPFVSLDVYDAADGSRQRVEVPWTGAPTVSGAGPGILIGDGGTRSAVVDPDGGEVSVAAPKDLRPPKGCATCRQFTAVHGLTAKGLLVGGAREFWVRDGWFSRDVAPSGADRANGVPVSLDSGRLLVRWQKAKGTRAAATRDLWAVHDAASGRPLVTAECHKPAIEPGTYPQAALSPGLRYLVAGNLAFDLEERTGRCFEEPDGTRPLALTTVTDAGLAYGATDTRRPAEALAGGGAPHVVDLATGVPEPLPPGVRLPVAEASGVGVFRWTDQRDRLHLIGYARKDRVDTAP